MIILDLFLPELSGWEILSRLKSMSAVASIPIVVCSVLECDTQRPEMRFVDAYLQKPFSRQALRRAIRTALSSAQPEHESDLVEAQLKKALMISAQEEGKRRDQISYRADPLVVPSSASLATSQSVSPTSQSISHDDQRGESSSTGSPMVGMTTAEGAVMAAECFQQVL